MCNLRLISMIAIAIALSNYENNVYAQDVAKSFEFPVENYENTICFDWGEYRNSARHIGQDIRCGSIGAPVIAVANGKVKFARAWKSVCEGNWGDVMVIEHILNDNSKVCSIYGHININVNEGTIVTRGQKIGTIKDYYCASGWTDHLHFSIYLGEYGNYNDYPSWLHGYLESNQFPGNYTKPDDFIKAHSSLPDEIFVKGSSSEIYLLKNNILHHITDYSIYERLRDYKYGEYQIWNDEDLKAYFRGSKIISDGLICKEESNPDIYLIQYNKKRSFTNESVYSNRGYVLNGGDPISPTVIWLADGMLSNLEFDNNSITDNGISVAGELYFMKSGERSTTFYKGDTKESYFNLKAGDGYTVLTYLRITKPNGSQVFAYYPDGNTNGNFYESVSKTPLMQENDFGKTFNIQPNNWNKPWLFNSYTISNSTELGTYTWEYWYEDINKPGEILFKDTKSYTIANLQNNPLVYGITPNSGRNNGSVDITNLSGMNFQNGASVKLMMSGQNDINATNINVENSNKITCRFNLKNRAVGVWDVLVTNPDGKNSGDSGDALFTIYQPSTGNISVSDVQGSTGMQVVVNISIANNSEPIDAFGFDVLFDSDMLDYNEVKRGDLTQDFDFFDANLSSDILRIGGLDASAIPVNSNGTIAQIVFTVDCQNCQSGENSSLQLSNLKDDIAGFNISNGTFSFQSCLLGDVNMDNNITPGDALCSFQTYLHGEVPPGDCNTECALYATDADCNGNTTPGDALIIFNAYLNGLEPPLQCPQIEKMSQLFENDMKLEFGQITLKNDTILLPIMLKSLKKIKAFGLDLIYPASSMNYLSLNRSLKIESYYALESKQLKPGLVRIGGFDPAGVKYSSMDTLIVLTFKSQARFKTKNIEIVNLKDDLAFATLKHNKAEIQASRTIDQKLPEEFSLEQNYPNPFNLNTKIEYELPVAANVKIIIFNTLGSKIRTLTSRYYKAGRYHINWNGRNEKGEQLPSGIYIYQMQTGSFSVAKKLLLMK